MTKEHFTTVSGMTKWKMEEEDNSIEISLSFKGIGKMMFPMEREEKYSTQDKSMKENGKMEICMEEDSSSKKMAHPIQEIGYIICSTATVSRNGQMALSTKATFLMESKKDMV